MTFNQWLKTKEKDESPTGDLARDAAIDSSFPNQDDFPNIVAAHAAFGNYLDNFNLTEVFDDAWEDFVSDNPHLLKTALLIVGEREA